MKKMRKPTPQPAKWFWFANDGCWNCRNRNGCRGCKILKQQSTHEKEKINRKQKEEVKSFRY